MSPSSRPSSAKTGDVPGRHGHVAEPSWNGKTSSLPWRFTHRTPIVKEQTPSRSLCLGAQGHSQPRDMPYLSGTACFLLRSSKSGHPKGTRLIPGGAITWPKRVPGTCVFHKNENRNQTTTTTVPHNCI